MQSPMRDKIQLHLLQGFRHIHYQSDSSFIGPSGFVDSMSNKDFNLAISATTHLEQGSRLTLWALLHS